MRVVEGTDIAQHTHLGVFTDGTGVHDDDIRLKLILRHAVPHLREIAAKLFAVGLVLLAAVGVHHGEGPDSVIDRAKHCLDELIENRGITALPEDHVHAAAADSLSQISFADLQADEIRETLRKTDLNTLTPLEALNLLYSLQRKAMQ